MNSLLKYHFASAEVANTLFGFHLFLYNGNIYWTKIAGIVEKKI